MSAITLTPFAVDVENGITLRGTVYYPDSSETPPVGAVVLFHGFTGQRMENGRLFVTLARQLAARGYAVLTYDRFGHGESDGELYDMAVSRDVTQAAIVTAAFLNQVGLPANCPNVHYVGFSLGAVIAGAAAGAAASAAADATGAAPIASLTMWSVASLFAERIRAGFILDKPISQLYQKGYIDIGGQRLGSAIVADGQSFDPYQAAAPYQGPVLLLHGKEDFIPVACSQQYAKQFGSQATLDIVANADHSWDTVPFRDYLYKTTISHITSHQITSHQGPPHDHRS